MAKSNVQHRPAQRRHYSKGPGGGITSKNPAGFKTIVARYPGTCKRCGAAVEVGSPVRWAPKRGTYHMADQCAGLADAHLDAELTAAQAGEGVYIDPDTGAVKPVTIDEHGDRVIVGQYDGEVF